jgi:putative spermidine/putrescine transport system permease protein
MNNAKAITLAGALYIGAVYVFLLAPILLILAMSFNAGELLAFPPSGFSFRWYVAAWENSQFRSAFATSIQVALVATVGAGLLGVAAAMSYAQLRGRGRETIRQLLLSPILLPEVLTAVAILIAIHVIGSGPSYWTLQAGHILIGLPYVFVNVVASLQNADANLGLAARGLGASRWVVLRRVTLPLAKSGILSGCLFAFVISFDTYNISMLLKGLGMTTLPLALADYMNWDLDPSAAAVSGASICLTILVVVLVDRLVGLRTVRF